ncbi:MAG: type II toxin-antitoxin system Phd/YefM family antitoxin [Chloroflexi bacterium]|nr:type II toxin-antitoxin system Phd/YefM family antitoxin [Chloroflexota bacterium]
MKETSVSIGQVKRDISELVNRVAYGDERIIFTSRGRPKAVLVSISDYRDLQEKRATVAVEQWRQWLAQTSKISAAILERRKGYDIDVDELLRQEREELDERSDWVRSSD